MLVWWSHYNPSSSSDPLVVCGLLIVIYNLTTMLNREIQFTHFFCQLQCVRRSPVSRSKTSCGKSIMYVRWSELTWHKCMMSTNHCDNCLYSYKWCQSTLSIVIFIRAHWTCDSHCGRSGSESQPLVARALHDFTAERSNELSFSAGDELVWLSACTGMISIIHVYTQRPIL